MKWANLLTTLVTQIWPIVFHMTQIGEVIK
jgi:hypothetical protein